MKFDKDTEEFIHEFLKALREDNLCIFAGAGLSVNSGYFDWKKLLKPVADKLNLDINDEYDLTALAQYFIDDKLSRVPLNQILVEEFNRTGITLSKNHSVLARLPISIYWTTNFDDLIEISLKKAGKSPDVKRNQDDLSMNVPHRDAIVYKMHGDITDITRTVIAKHDYEDYNKTRELFSNAFKADFVSRTMVFIGFSFNDPNLDYLISRIRSIQLGNKKPDYYFIKKDTDAKKHNRQKIRANSLKQYGLNPIWIDDYPEITSILEEIERRFLRSSVFISGSAQGFYSRYFYRELDAQTFIQELSQKISSAGYKIGTGFGGGVGMHVITGAWSNMVAHGHTKIDPYIILRPFPLSGRRDEESRRQKEAFRENMIREFGIAIFIFGNKLKDGNHIISEGVMSEFAYATEAGLKIIPVGITGYASNEIWRLVMDNFGRFFLDYPDLKTEFEKLNNHELSSDQIIETILIIINRLNEF